MEQPPLMGIRTSEMQQTPELQATLQSLGIGFNEAMGLFASTALLSIYGGGAIPQPPVSPACAAASDGVDRISRLPDAILRNAHRRARRPLDGVDADRMAPGGDDSSSALVVAAASRALAAHPGPFRCVHLTWSHMASHRAEIARWLELLAGKVAKSPVLEVLTVIASMNGVRLRLVSRTLRCLQLSMSSFVDITVVDAPRLERLLLWMISPNVPSKMSRSRVNIRHAPNLRMLGCWQPDHELEINNTIIKAGTKSLAILALELHFEVHNELKMVPTYLKCFPNVETLHIYSQNADKTAGKLNLKFWQDAGHIECLQRHVKKLVVEEFRGKRSELVFLKSVAERAQVLDKMVIMVASECFSSLDNVSTKLKPPLQNGPVNTVSCMSSRVLSLMGQLLLGISA
ncbi:hypothetical protein ACP4OV_001473 [Aristida adscensionis]